MALLKERLAKESSLTKRLDEIRAQIAGQAKIRNDMESRLAEAAQSAGALDKEIKQLNASMVESGRLIMANEKEIQAVARAEEDLKKEKDLAEKSAAQFSEKEKGLKRSGAEKEELKKKLAARNGNQ
jgi:chromosome segregation ATPase